MPGLFLLLEIKYLERREKSRGYKVKINANQTGFQLQLLGSASFTSLKLHVFGPCDHGQLGTAIS